MLSGNFRSKPVVLLLIFSMLLVQCGDNKDDQNGGKNGRTASETAFYNTANEQQIPVRLLIASGYLESGLNPKAAGTANLVGPARAESAFGMPRSVLGVAEGSGGDRLSAQIEAYGRWVSRNLSGGLKATPETDEDKFQWIWAFAEIHRSDDSTRVLYAKEFISLLNRGFQWVDPETFQILTVEPESPSIDPENMREVFRNHLELSGLTYGSPDAVDSSQYLPRKQQGSHGQKQNPKKVRVIHCPFSFSTCVQMQLWDGKSEKDFWLGAHYLIPQDASQHRSPLQIELHNRAVPFTQDNGELGFSQNEVIVMLTGAAGKVSKGKRSPANPGWMTSWQLLRMGELIRDICDKLAYKNEDLTLQNCLTEGNGLSFFHQTNNEFQWGHIPDYDKFIFKSYIENSQMLTGKTVFEYPGNKIFFKSGEAVTLNLTFGLRARSILLEQMIRCPGDGSVRWTTVSRDDLNSISSFLFQKNIFDPGPNQNGTHYFRAKVLGENNNLIGWDLATVYVTDYRNGPAPTFPGDCP